MSKFIEIDPLELEGNIFREIGKDWMLISAGNEQAFNTMTASWGGMGVLWNANVTFAFVPPAIPMGFLKRRSIIPSPFPARQAAAPCKSAAVNPAGIPTRRPKRD